MKNIGIGEAAQGLLGRTGIPEHTEGVRGLVEGRTVLVTGAGGSIGSELARQVHGLKPRRLVLLDRDETMLQAMQLELRGNGLLSGDELVLASIRDADQMRTVFDSVRPNVVFHAAALKHLPLLEKYPHEAVRTNVLGTLNVVSAAVGAGADVIVNVSTDKAADPTSVLGASKRVAEILTQAHAVGISDLSSVRFGNVLGSRGSFLPLLADRVAAGAPVHLTHPDVTRFFMTIPEAAYLVINAASMGATGEVFVLDMGQPVRILDLIHNYCALLDAPTPEIVVTGLRPGEKLHEVVFSDSESRTRTSHPLIYRTEPTPIPDDFAYRLAPFEHVERLSRGEVMDVFLHALGNFRASTGLVEVAA